MNLKQFAVATVVEPTFTKLKETNTGWEETDIKFSLRTLKLSNFTMEGPDRTYRSGLRGSIIHRRGKTARIEMVDALGTVTALNHLLEVKTASSGNLKNEKSTFRTTLESGDNTIVLGSPLDLNKKEELELEVFRNSVKIQEIQEDSKNGYEIADNGRVLILHGDAQSNMYDDLYEIRYFPKENAGISIQNSFAGSFKMEGNVLLLGRDGKRRRGRIIVDNFVPDSLFHLQMETDGDFATFDLSGEVIPTNGVFYRILSDAIVARFDTGSWTAGYPSQYGVVPMEVKNPNENIIWDNGLDSDISIKKDTTFRAIGWKNPENPSAAYLTFESDEARTITPKFVNSVTMQYKTDESGWTEISSGEPTTEAKKIYFRGASTKKSLYTKYSDDNAWEFDGDASNKIKVSGSLGFLLKDNLDDDWYPLEVGEYAFSGIFEDGQAIVKLPSLHFNSVGDYAFYKAFKNNTSLENIPEITSTEAGISSYEETFKGCISAVQIGALPVMDVKEKAFKNAFSMTRNLTWMEGGIAAKKVARSGFEKAFEESGILSAPEIEAEHMEKESFYKMFNNAYGLIYAPTEFRMKDVAERGMYEMFRNNISMRQGPKELVFGTVGEAGLTRAFYNTQLLRKAPDIVIGTVEEEGLKETFMQNYSLPRIDTFRVTNMKKNGAEGIFKLNTNLISTNVEVTNVEKGGLKEAFLNCISMESANVMVRNAAKYALESMFERNLNMNSIVFDFKKRDTEVTHNWVKGVTDNLPEGVEGVEATKGVMIKSGDKYEDEGVSSFPSGWTQKQE